MRKSAKREELIIVSEQRSGQSTDFLRVLRRQLQLQLQLTPPGPDTLSSEFAYYSVERTVGMDAVGA